MDSTQPLLLLLDYDGTLVAFAPRPEQAPPDGDLLELLTELSRGSRTMVHVVSGRGRESLEAWLGRLHLGIHAEHGLWSKQGPEQPWRMVRDVSKDWKPEVRDLLANAVTKTPGSFIEERTASLVWHFRLASPERAAACGDELRRELSVRSSRWPVQVLSAQKAIEVRVRGIDKGDVVRTVTASLDQGATVLAMGDDRTDEDMFGALPKEGLAVHVGPAPSVAPYRLSSPPAARALLREILVRSGS